MIPIPCVSGLFVGIGNYGERSGFQDLPGALASAQKIMGHFSTAFSDGNWKSLISDKFNVLNKCDILEEFQQWLPKIPPGKAGLFYFCGHGSYLDREYLLIPSDFRSTIPLCSGIKLSDLFDIVQNYSPESYIAFVLDTCRSNKQIPLRIPENICVLFSAEEGKSAFSTSTISKFSEAFLNELKTKPTVKLESFLGMSISTVASRIRTNLIKSMFNLQKPILNGHNTSRICFPINSPESLMSLDLIRTKRPDCYLLSRCMAMNLLRAHANTVAKVVEGWFGSYTLPEDVITCIQEKRGQWRLLLKLPGESFANMPHEFVNYMLLTVNSLFHDLVISAKKPIKHNRLRLVSPQDYPINWRRIADSESIGLWEQGRCSGVVSISTDTKAKLKIQCQSKEGNLLCLDNLLPSLNQIIDQLYFSVIGEM